MTSATLDDDWAPAEKYYLIIALNRYEDNYVEVSRLVKNKVAYDKHLDSTNFNRYTPEACALQFMQLKKAHAIQTEGCTSAIIEKLKEPIVAEYRKVVMERIYREKEVYDLAQKQIEMMQKDQVSDEEALAIMQRFWQHNEEDRIKKMKFDKKLREFKEEEAKWQASRPANLKIKSESDTKTIDMDVEDITSNNNKVTGSMMISSQQQHHQSAPIQQQQQQVPQQQVPPASISPLLSSLLKSPTSSGNPNLGSVVSAPSAHNATARATATAPTITTLLTSGSIPNQNQPAITLKSMPPKEAAQLLTRPISGPPIESTSSGGQTHTAPQHVLSPSQSAPTLSMLLEKTKIAPGTNQHTTPADKVESITVTEPVPENVSSAEVAMDIDEDVGASHTNLTNAESDETDPAEEQQLLEVFKSIGNIADIEGIDVAAVIQDEERFLKDVEEEPCSEEKGGADTEEKEENDKEKSLQQPKNVDEVLSESDVQKAAFSTDDDEDDDMPLAAVTNQEHNTKDLNSVDSQEKNDFLKEKVESASKKEFENDETGEDIIETNESKPASPSDDVEEHDTILNEEPEEEEKETNNQNNEQKSPAASEESSDVILIPTDDDSSNAEKKTLEQEAEETSEANDEVELPKSNAAVTIDVDTDVEDLKTQEVEVEAETEEADQTLVDEEQAKDALKSGANIGDEPEQHPPTADVTESSSSMQAVDTPDPQTLHPPTISIMDTDDSSTTDVSIITRRDERIPSPSKLPHQPRRSVHDQKGDDLPMATAASTAPPARPPLLRKLRKGRRGYQDATGTLTNDNLANQRLRRRYSSTPVSDSFPSSPASSEREDRDARISKKQLLSIYNALQPQKYTALFQRVMTDPAYGACLRPIDMQTIKKQIESGEIRSTIDLHYAVMLMCTNANLVVKVGSEDERGVRQFLKDCNHIREFGLDRVQVKAEKNKEQNPSTSTSGNNSTLAAPAVAPSTSTPPVSGLEKKIKRSQNKKRPERGILFIKHLPRGCYEEQLQKYLEQFGRVTRLRLVRSRRTGGSKGFAFVEFEVPEVAEVAAQTMDNYIMFQKVIKAAYIPPEEQKHNYFHSSVRKKTNKAGKEIYVSKKTASIQRPINRYSDWKQKQKLKKPSEDIFTLEDLLSDTIAEDTDDPDFALSDTSDEENYGIGKSSDSESEEDDAMTAKQDTEKQKLKKTSKDKIKLEDLLGDTIAEDSDDSEFALSDLSEQDNSDSEENEAPPTKLNKSANKLKMDTFEILTKRKPLAGGIKKSGKNNTAKKSAKAAKTTGKTLKSTLQVTAAKEIAKPLAAFKTKNKSKNKQGR